MHSVLEKSNAKSTTIVVAIERSEFLLHVFKILLLRKRSLPQVLNSCFHFAMHRLRSISKAAFLLCMLGLCLVLAQDTHYRPVNQLIPAPDCLSPKGAWQGGSTPCTGETHRAWLTDLRHWRDERKIRVGYNGWRYERPELKWTQSSFIQPQMMTHDRYFYDPGTGKYTVDKYLDDLANRYGGIDSVLIWPTYPNMGIDDRNQHDMIRSMPGGVEGLKAMIADFHRRSVRVFFPMMMWDQGTER
jgi:iron(II)-dependent oxidoreductase